MSGIVNVATLDSESDNYLCNNLIESESDGIDDERLKRNVKEENCI